MRMIDADKFKEDLLKLWDYSSVDGITATTVLKQVISDLDNAPTVDIRNKGACEDCEYFDRPITSEPCRNCTLAYGSCFKEKEKVKDDRPKGEWITRHKLNSFGQDVVCFECNKCGEYKVPLYHLFITEPLSLCPNCGADMRKGGAE